MENLKVKVDNKEKAIKDGFVLKDELNETLDSGTIIFIDKENDIEPFDSVVIEATDIDRKKLLVDTFHAETIDIDKDNLENSTYEYIVNLFSETKILERITCPNLAITRHAVGTARSVWDYVKWYCLKYIPAVKIHNGTGGYSYKTSIMYDEALETKLNMDCPEFVWNTPTLREVLNDLFSVANCLPIIKDNVLTFFDFTAKGNPINTNFLTNTEFDKTSADYCDSLTLPMKNIISKQPVVVKERLLPRSTEGEMTSNNAVYITKKPIYAIKKCYIYVKYAPENLQTRLEKIDITNQIIEKEAYEILGNQTTRVDYATDAIKRKYFNFFFSRGGNTIEGIGKTYELRVGSSVKVSYGAYMLVAGAGMSKGASSPSATTLMTDIFAIKNNGKSYDTPFIELEYETIEENTINVSKQTPIKNPQNYLFDSQNANSVDLEHQSIYEYAKANRLSSKIKTIYGQYTDEADLPQLSDYLGDYVLFSREISYLDDMILFKGLVCPNYILRDYFTGVISTRRSWNIVDTNEAIIKNDNQRIFIEFASSPVTFNQENTHPAIQCINTYFDYDSFIRFNTSYSDPKNLYSCALLQTRDKNYTRYPVANDITKYAIVDMLLEIMPYSISYVFNTYDNFSFGDQIAKEDNMFVMEQLRYTDENGEIERVFVKLCDKISEEQQIGKDTDVEIAWIMNHEHYTDTLYDELIGELRKTPLIQEGAETKSLKFNIAYPKDNREILSLTLQFEYVSNDENIIVGETYTNFVKAGKGLSSAVVKVTRNYKYKQNQTTPATTGDVYNTTILLYDSSSSHTGLIGMPLNIQIGENDAWCVYSGNKIILAVNGKQQIYANMMFTRDDNIYNNQIDKVKIGKWWDSAQDIMDNAEENPAEVDEIKVLRRTIELADIKNFNE